MNKLTKEQRKQLKQVLAAAQKRIHKAGPWLPMLRIQLHDEKLGWQIVSVSNGSGVIFNDFLHYLGMSKGRRMMAVQETIADQSWLCLFDFNPMTVSQWADKLAAELSVKISIARKYLEAAQEQLDQDEDDYSDQDVYDLALIMGKM